MSQRFKDLQTRAEALLIALTTIASEHQRRALLQELRALIDDLDLEVAKAPPHPPAGPDPTMS